MNRNGKILETSGILALWETNDGTNVVYRITDDGSGYCNSVEEMSGYYTEGTEIDLVREIMNRGNKILFENLVSGEEHTYEEYIEQFEKDEDFPIMPYVDFKSYKKAKEIWDLLK